VNISKYRAKELQCAISRPCNKATFLYTSCWNYTSFTCFIIVSQLQP